MTSDSNGEGPEGDALVSRVPLTYRPAYERHEALRTIAFKERRTIQSLLDEGVDLLCERHARREALKALEQRAAHQDQPRAPGAHEQEG